MSGPRHRSRKDRARRQASIARWQADRPRQLHRQNADADRVLGDVVSELQGADADAPRRRKEIRKAGQVRGDRGGDQSVAGKSASLSGGASGSARHVLRRRWKRRWCVRRARNIVRRRARQVRSGGVHRPGWQAGSRRGREKSALAQKENETAAEMSAALFYFAESALGGGARLSTAAASSVYAEGVSTLNGLAT